MNIGTGLAGLLLLGLFPALAAAAGRSGDAVVLSGETYEIAFSTVNGAILSLSPRGGAASVLRSGEHGLWHVRFRDGSEVAAADFSAHSAERSFNWQREGDSLRMTFQAPEVAVTIVVTGGTGGLDFVGEVAPEEKTVLDFALPARLRFDPSQVKRLVFPMDGNQSVGTAFRAAFFEAQPAESPAGWRPEMAGPAGYIALYGGPLTQRADGTPPTALKVTPEGRAWLGTELADRVGRARAVVNRPPTPEQADLVLVDSPDGPYFSATRLGGKGRIWRLGGPVGEGERRNAADMVAAVIGRLAQSEGPQRSKVGLIALTRGPETGGWATVPVRQWRRKLQSCRAVVQGRAELVELTTPSAMMDALAGHDFLAILNPYGEWCPVPQDGDVEATVAAVGRYVRDGGNWFEVGGYPFYYALRPQAYFRHSVAYPAAFADFLHLDTEAGSASVYGVQPQKWPPWAGAQNREAVFVPGRLACGGDGQGGYCQRAFGTYVEPGRTWRAPTVRLTVGDSAAEGLAAYCDANRINRRLEDKMPPDLLARFKESVLVYYGGPARDKMEHLDLLPVPTQVHFADYLKGGFDKEYPDHLPPHPWFGTPEELRAFFARCRELGHLVVPYTNPTWWCDKPRGPTFAREGEAPLLRKLDGTLSYERYGQNDGYTVCHWHPAVRAANRKTVRQFTDEYPVDLLFQDQCGARSWSYDMNAASPTPYAYADGLVSMVAEDCRAVPLSTEAGWDRVVNYESQLCGMTWAIVPTENPPSWRRMMKHDYPPHTWEVFPLAQHVAHDKAAMLHHDLGQFVTNREVLAWTLGLGFCMSYVLEAPGLAVDGPREWLKWLDRLQKSVCARYVGEPVRAFEHDRGPAPALEDDGLIRATYGPVELVANLGPAARADGARQLAPYGFYASAPGMVAGNLARLGGMEFGEEGLSFVVEGEGPGAELWVYAPARQEVCVELPGQVSGRLLVKFDGRPAEEAAAAAGILRLRLPAAEGTEQVQPPPDLAGKAPRAWSAEPPAIGVLDLGMEPALTRITPQQWLDAFRRSTLATKLGAPIKRIATVEELDAALEAGATQWFAIVNPYGESFPVAAAGRWRPVLDAIAGYVRDGGCWWETAGYPFYYACSPGPDGWQVERVGVGGAEYVGLRVGGGPDDPPPEALRVSQMGREWLGKELSDLVERQASVVNRSLARGFGDPGHLTLVTGREQDFIGGCRLNGWGWLWRIGGFLPNPEVALPVAVAVTEHLYDRPPLPALPPRTKYLWHATVEPVAR